MMPTMAMPETRSLPGGSELPLFAGFALSAAVGWLLVPHQKFQSLTQVFIFAAIHTGLTVAASVMGFRITSYLLARRAGPVSSYSIAIASWIAPLAVCLSYASILALPIAVLVAGSITSVVRRGYGIPDDAESPPQPTGADKKIFQLLRPPPLSRFLWMSLAAFCLQGGTVAALSGKVASGAALASLAAVFIVWQSAHYRTMRAAARRVRNLVSSWIILAIAFLLTVGAIHSRRGGSGNLETAGKIQDGHDGHFRGIFLVPDRPREDQPRQNVSLPYSAADMAPKSRVPLKIPFDGEYWFFQPPDSKPPSDATVMHGVPGQVGFHSTNSRPIWMEAHQSLSSPFDLTTFRSIQVEVRNSDSYPGSVPLELIVSDSKKLRATLSLGRAEIAEKSTSGRTGRIMTLTFQVPAVPRIASFDRLTFRFLPNPVRWQFSPAITIESITVNPR
jgi:hypothetical protein